MRGRSLAVATALVAVTPFLQACTTSDVIEVEIASVEIEPPSPIVTGGATIQLNATVSDGGGTVIPQAVVEWSSDDETIATVDDTGRVWGRSAGTTMIRASFRSVNGTASITVQPGPSIGAIPDSVSLFGPQASSPSAAVQIENRGVGTLSGLQASVEYEGTASGWLPVTLTGSTGPTTLMLTAVTSGLSVGSYRALVWLAGVAENSPLPVPVNLTVTENEPIIELTPSSLTIEGVQGRPPSGPAMVQVTNAENGSLTGLSTSVWYVGSAAGWLSAALASSTAPTEVSVVTDARALQPGTYRGEVRVASPGAANDPEAISVTFVVAPAPEVADLSVSISGPPATTSGSRIEYVATVRNNGPDPATSVQATVTIPSGASFVSSSAGVHAGGIVTWGVGALPPGGPRSLTIVVDVGASTTGTLVSSASVSSATADPSLGNNAASATTTVSPPAADVSMLKLGPASAQVGSRITYTLRVANAGPAAAATVVVVDTLPSGTTFVSSTGGTHSNRIVNWSVGNLAGGASREINVVVDLATMGQVTNRAHVRAGTPDPAGGNNTSTVTTAVSAPDPEPESSCDIRDRTLGDDVEIPRNTTCTFTNVRVRGDVELRSGSRLIGSYLTVDGDIKADRADELVLTNSRVDDKVEFKDGGSVTIRDSYIDGDIVIEKNHGSIEVRDSRIEDKLSLKDNRGGPFVILRNTISGDLECSGNAPPPSGGGNAVDGDTKGQCREL